MAEFDGEPGSASSKEGTEGVAPAAAKPEECPSTATPISVKCSELALNGFPKNGINVKQSKSYKAGSKINQLADMLAKRSQKTVQAIDDTQHVYKTEEIAPKQDHEGVGVVAPPSALNNPEDSTKPVKTRSSPRCKREVNSILTDNNVAKRVKTKKQQKISKKLVETSTQTCEPILVVKQEEDEGGQEEQVLAVAEIAPVPLSDTPIYICLFCQLTFNEKTDCLNHEATHSLKRKTKFIKCQFCSKKLPNLEEFKAHGVKHHGPNFILCMECDLRFLDDHSLLLHTKADHYVFEPVVVVPDSERSQLNKKVKTGLDIDVNCEPNRKPSISPRSQFKQLSPKTDEQLYEAEMLFYSHLSGNIQENLLKHLDGKINEAVIEVIESSSAVLPVVSNNSCPAAVPVARAPSPYQTRSKTPNPLPTTAKKFKKLPNWQQKFWEKYNFPTNYRFQHRFWDKNYISSEKSPLYLKDLSCLDIKTQLTMRENVKKLEQVPQGANEDEERLKDTFPYFLNLVPEARPPVTEIATPPKVELIKVPKKKIARKVRDREVPPPQVVTRRQSEMGNARQRKGSLDLSLDKKMILRRQTSLENLEPSKEQTLDNSTIISKETALEPSLITGEWVRPRSYLCSACCAKFSNLSELEDHKWATHPNVWCTHYEFEDAKLEKMLQICGDGQPGASITLPDIYRRFLHAQGSLQLADTVNTPSFPQTCTKCRKISLNQPELHKHLLECGGDTRWFLTMCSSPATMKRRWRPYGSRRRRQIAQGVKRNNSLPSTPPPLRSSYCTPKVRTKPGDMETIQKMLANLPEKRTRRAINFDEINTRSQSTIHSNRLLRKRFNASFGSNFLRRKALTVRKLKPGSKTPSESGSKVGSDESTEPTPSSSPRRKFRLKEVTVDVTPITVPVEAAIAGPSTKKTKKKNKKEIARKGMLVKKIKNKLKTSKKLLEVRKEKTRRSGRIKEKVKIEDEAFTAEESLTPISKLSAKKKITVPPEMPKLDPEEPTKTRKSKSASSPELPILKPFEETEDVRFVVKKVNKRNTLKLVKEKKTEKENGSDNEPLIVLKKNVRKKRPKPKKKPEEKLTQNLERVISDQLVKKKKDKKEEPKRLCLTVTLKEATLKVLDKPTTPPGPNKWTVSTPADSAINFKMEPEAKNEENAGLLKNVDSPPMQQIVTIVEATSTDDAQEQPTSTCEPKIVEADSSVATNEEDDLKTEMIVSSSEPSKPKKRQKKKQTVDFESKDEVPSSTLVVPEELDRRTRRKSKEVPNTNEFIIDDPFLLVDELWSDLDSDSDSKQKKRKTKKKIRKVQNKQVDLEELLRNFGENKGEKKPKKEYCGLSSRQKLERRIPEEKSFRRFSLRLFEFNQKTVINGRAGSRLTKVKKMLEKSMAEPLAPVLPSQVVENPEQVIVCRTVKQKMKKLEPMPQLKVSLPLDLIGDLSLLNNNHLQSEPPKPECCVGQNETDEKREQKRSDVIDKIFYCEICKTYYYSPSQLKNHKMSNRHKMKEAELFENHLPIAEAVNTLNPTETDILEDDTSDMPVLEGPFIETPRADPPPPPAVFSFSEENLKDIQKAIGCTDDEMLILTFLGENATPEPDLLDLSNYTAKRDSEKPVDPPNKANGVLKVDLKQRMTTALASLVSKAVNNLLNKSETANKPMDTFLSKLSGLSARRKSTSNEVESLLGETSEVRYKYQCTICGNRFEKETTRDYHIIRTHRVGKRSKTAKTEVDDLATSPTDWHEPWYDCDDLQPTSQFWCSDCGINFVSPKEVLEHQRAEHALNVEDEEPKPVPQKRISTLDPDQERLLANQELQKLGSRRVTKRPRKNSGGIRKLNQNSEGGLLKTVVLNGDKSGDVYDFNEFDSEPEPVVFAHLRKKVRENDEDSEDNLPLAAVKPAKSDVPSEDEKKESFKISLENRLLKLDDIPLKKSTPACSEEDTLPLPSKPETSTQFDDQLNGNIIYQRNDSDTSNFNNTPSYSESESNDSEEENGRRRQKKIVPLLSATLTNVERKSESPKLNKEEIVKKIWSRQKLKPVEEPEERSDNDDDDDDLKITEFSDEVVIKCGPKPQPANRRRSLNETAKNAIVRRIWSGKAFQTKAALKTYDSDVMPPLLETPVSTEPAATQPAKRRGRPASMSAMKKKRLSSDEDDLDSLLEEIEQENVEKAIRLEFLHLRRSEKPTDTAAEPAGLFAEIQGNDVKDEKKKRKMRKNVNPMKRKQSLMDFRDRHHRRHRHRHHHHKHKHKRSHHHKKVIVKHKKHKPEPDDYLTTATDTTAQPLQKLSPFHREPQFNGDCSEGDKV